MYGEIFSVIANCQIGHFAIFYQFYQYLTVQRNTGRAVVPYVPRDKVGFGKNQ